MINTIRESLLLLVIVIFLILSIPNYTVAILFSFGVFIYLFYFFINKKLRNIGKKIQTLFNAQIKNVNENFISLDILKIYQKENFFLKKFSKLNKEREKLSFKLNLINKFPKILIELVSIFFSSISNNDFFYYEFFTCTNSRNTIHFSCQCNKICAFIKFLSNIVDFYEKS